MRKAISFLRSTRPHSALLPLFSSPTKSPAAPRAAHQAHQPPSSKIRFAGDFCAVIRNLSRNLTNPRALTALDSILSRAHLLDSATIVLVLRGLSLTRKLTRAKSLLSALKNKGVVPDLFVYSLVLQCLLPSSAIRDVESTWQEVSGGAPPINASDFVVHLCRQSDNASEIENVFHRASSSGWGLTRQAYVCLIGAMCGQNNPNPGLARSVLREMEERGFEAEGFTYFTLFQSFCRAGNLSEADSVLKVMIDRKNYDIDSCIYGNFLHGLCKTGKFRESRKLFEKMTKKDCRVAAPAVKPGRRVIFQLSPPATISERIAFASYFQSLCTAGKVDEAERLLKDAMEKNIVPDICVYRSFIDALFKIGRADDAIRIFEAERKKGHDASIGNIAATAVIAGLCDTGRVDDGYRLLLEMVDCGFAPSAPVWNQILQSYWDSGRVESAMGLFNRIRAEEFDNCSMPNASTYGVMVQGFLEKGDIVTAVSLVEETVEMKIRLNAGLHGAVARGLRANRGLEEAHEYLNQMIENGSLVSYATWESLFDSMTMDSGDDILLSYGSASSSEEMNVSSKRWGKNGRSKE